MMQSFAGAIAIATVGALAACHATGDDYMVVPGGGGPGGTGSGSDPILDAPSNDGNGDLIVGRVCVRTDPRDRASCAVTGADGITVTLGSSLATTVADGGFVIARPISTDLEWHVGGGGAMPALMPFGPTFVIPTISIARFQDFIGDNGVLFTDGTGAIFVNVVAGTAPLPGALVSTSPPANSLTFYDGNNARTWDQDMTGAFGMAWVPEQGAGFVDVAVTPAGGTSKLVLGVPVENQSLTFITVEP